MKQTDTKTKKRLFYLITALLLFMTEVLIALFVHDRFIRPYAGDILVVLLIYTLIRIFFPERPHLLPLYVFLLASGVELLQYFEIVRILGLENHALVCTLIGTTFDVRDILCYAAGTVLTGLWELFVLLRRE